MGQGSKASGRTFCVIAPSFRMDWGRRGSGDAGINFALDDEKMRRGSPLEGNLASIGGGDHRKWQVLEVICHLSFLSAILVSNTL